MWLLQGFQRRGKFYLAANTECSAGFSRSRWPAQTQLLRHVALRDAYFTSNGSFIRFKVVLSWVVNAIFLSVSSALVRENYGVIFLKWGGGLLRFVFVTVSYSTIFANSSYRMSYKYLFVRNYLYKSVCHIHNHLITPFLAV